MGSYKSNETGEELEFGERCVEIRGLLVSCFAIRSRYRIQGAVLGIGGLLVFKGSACSGRWLALCWCRGLRCTQRRCWMKLTVVAWGLQ